MHRAVGRIWGFLKGEGLATSAAELVDGPVSVEVATVRFAAEVGSPARSLFHLSGYAGSSPLIGVREGADFVVQPRLLLYASTALSPQFRVRFERGANIARASVEPEFPPVFFRIWLRVLGVWGIVGGLFAFVQIGGRAVWPFTGVIGGAVLCAVQWAINNVSTRRVVSVAKAALQG